MKPLAMWYYQYFERENRIIADALGYKLDFLEK